MVRVALASPKSVGVLGEGSPYQHSKQVYGHIKDNLASRIEQAIKVRNRYN
jgi:hypothetical protein